MDLENSRRTPWVDQLVDIVDNVDMYVQPRVPQLPPARDKYPFARMEVGDSFLIINPDWVKNLRSAAHMYAKRHPGVKFTVRRHGAGWRVWRLS